MKASEVRLGNWVMGNKPYQINMSQFVTMQYNENIGLPEYFEPIEITEEWLIKFGFKYKHEPSYDQYYQLGFFAYCMQTESARILNLDWVCITTFDYPIKYVHQLQNIYHAIYGKELIARTQNK